MRLPGIALSVALAACNGGGGYSPPVVLVPVSNTDSGEPVYAVASHNRPRKQTPI